MSFLEFSDRRSKLGGLILDVLVSEEITLEAEVTRYPVEDGAVISDHITQGVETIRISGLVSTADVMAFSYLSSAVSLFSDNEQPASTKLVDAVDMLRSMHKARALVTVSTGQMIYTDMGFTSLRAVRSNSDKGGNWLEIQAELTKVRKVTLKSAEVPENKAKGAARGRAGATNTPAGKSSPTSTTGAAGADSQAKPSTPLLEAVRRLTGRS
ncbi:phage baseplate protein [Roseomonas chloroacetimidivorans]|uniref:phage baseplate protein n=1 Tax=Roseomonas chloroacetimidivorans TaxID=1766656 RepID=UPI003C7584A9